MHNENLAAAYEPTNIELFNTENLRTKAKDIQQQMQKTNNQSDYLQLRDYLLTITLELELRK